MAPSPMRSPKLFISQSMARVRVGSPSIRPKPEETDQKVEFLGGEMKNLGGDGDECLNGKNKVMIVVDSSSEAKGALDWTLSHAVQSQDHIVLLHVTKPNKHGQESDKRIDLRVHELLLSMKKTCQKRRPGVQVELAIREGQEKGAIIVEEAKLQSVSLLVLGQRRLSLMRRIIRRLKTTINLHRLNSRCCGGGRSTVEYCIRNSSCMTIAVRRKDKKLGGYLITTKRHKKFWLLA